MDYTEIEGMKEILRDKEEYIKKLEEENKSLKNELMEDMKTETKLNERIRFLEECLDNKEKVNNLLRGDIRWYEREEDRLREENKKLKESLDIATKCSSKEEEGIIRLSEENQTLKDNVEFLHSCLDDRDKSIELMKHKNELQEKALIRLCLKHHYDSIIIEGEEVIEMSNYKVVEKKKPKEEKLF